MKNQKVVALSYVASFLVVLIHTRYSTDNPWYHLIVQRGFCDVAVPFFFIVSGYFLMNHFDGTARWWKGQVLKRLGSLMGPYVLWNIIAVIALKPTGDWLRDFGITVITPRDSALWYIKSLFCVSVISPLIVLLARFFVHSRKRYIVGVVLSLIFLWLGHAWHVPAFHSWGRTIVYVTLGVQFALGAGSFFSQYSKGFLLSVCIAVWGGAIVGCLVWS